MCMCMCMCTAPCTHPCTLHPSNPFPCSPPAPCTHPLHAPPVQAKSLTAEAVHAMSLDPHRALELQLVASCYRMLYYLCWDHPDNWQPFSNGPTLRFLFTQMSELAGVYVCGEPLNW